jgi:hypothetical protein
MSSSDLERVQSDLSAMRTFLGFGRIWTMADVAFCGALAAAFGVYAVLTWPGSPVEVAGRISSAPIFAAIAAYLGYMAIKSRRLPPREEPRRREYKSTLLAIVGAVPAAVGYAYWSAYVGMTGAQIGGSLLAIIGVTTIILGVSLPAPLRYPRSYFIVPALPLLLFGAIIPLAPPAYTHALIGIMGLASVGLASAVMHRHVRRGLAEEGDHGGD